MESVQKFLSRRSESTDAGDIAKLVRRHTESLFGRVNAEYIIEHANLSVSLVSVESPSEVVGHMSFTDQPSSLPTDWAAWLREEHGYSKASPINALFLCLFVAKENFHQGASSEILRTVFMTAPLLQYLFLVIPRDSNIGSALSAHFSLVPCVTDCPTVDLARVEDTDDLMPVLLHHSPHITSLYGDYFLSELIASQDDHHRTLVAEVDGRAVGLMSVSTEVDVDLLRCSYLLEPYHCLRREHPDDEVLSVQAKDTPKASTAKISTLHAPTPHSSTAHTSTPHSSTAHTSTPHSSTAHTTTPHSSTAHTNTPHSSTAHTSTPHSSSQTLSHNSASSVCEPMAKADQGVESDPQERSKVTEKRWEYRLQGEPTALALQLFAIDERYEMRSVDFLPAVFTLFPDHDFLVLTQPHVTGDFPLLAHFTSVPPRPGTSPPQELYLTHKCSLLHSFEVGVAREEDVSGVKALVTQLSASESMVEDVLTFLRGKRDPHQVTPVTALVARCGGQLVGLAVLRGKEDLDYVRAHYNIEDFIYFSYHRPTEHAQLHHLILNPVFSPYAKHFIKEILRLSGSSCLYYHHSPSPQSKPLSLITTLHCLVPIKARRQVVYPEGLGPNSPLPEVTEVKPPFALYHTNRKLTFEPKISINCRVVIVGASQTALSLIESLVLCPHLHFSHITLVSPHGLASPPPLSLDTWISSIEGKVTAVNRSEQCVEVVSGGSHSTVHYDWLVLTCGLQYAPPTLKGIPPPTQVLTSVEQANQHPGPYVVFGSGLDAYCAVNQLLVNGVAPDLITLIQATAPQWTDPPIAERVGTTLSLTGINLFTDTTLSEWEVKEEGLVAVGTISSSGHAQSLPCKTLIYLGDKAVDRDAFKALNDACLVVDSRLVVGVDHSTNDPLILAGGPLTKFSRKYRVGSCSHADFNSEEVGSKLALTLLSKLDPTFDPDSANEQETKRVPQYTQPLVDSGRLPGGLHYLRIYAPPTPGEQYKENAKGRELVTDTVNGYFKIHISQYGRVDEMSMLSSSPLREQDNYVCLYSVHEKYLNNLMERFDQNLITDLYSYFREPWVCALFHDRFPDFMQEVREYLSLLPHKADSEASIEEMVRELVNEDPDSPLTSARAMLRAQFHSSPAKSLVSERLFRFLDYNKQQLPMYARPDPV